MWAPDDVDNGYIVVCVGPSRLITTVCEDGPVSTARRLLRTMTAGSVAVTLALGGCTDDSTPDVNGPAITVAMMQAGVLKGTDIGPTWKQPDQSPAVTGVIPFCGGLASRPPIPGKPSVVASSLADEGEKGAQAFDMVGLVYPDTAGADAAIETLHATAVNCAPTASRTAGPRDTTAEAGYTETTKVESLNSGGWSGFVVLRHKVYEATTPGTADTAVAVLAEGNGMVVASYGVYWIGQHSTGPEFDTDWRRLVATVLNRVEAKRTGAS